MSSLPSSDPDDALGSGSDNLDQEGAERLMKEVKQRITLRYIAVSMAIIVILYLGFLEWYLMNLLTIKSEEQPSPDVWIVILAISPILSTTAIVIFLLIGIFRGFRDIGMPNIPVGVLARKSFEGN